MVLRKVTIKIGIFRATERPSAAKAYIIFAQSWVFRTCVDSFVCILWLLERDESILCTGFLIMQCDLLDTPILHELSLEILTF